MPHMSGLELQAALVRSGNPLPVIFLTAHGDIPTSVHAMKGRAEDFLTKPVPKERLLTAVQRALAQNAATFGKDARRRKLQCQFDILTPREREVLALVSTGKLNKEIAGELGAAEGTIKAHRASIMEKFQVYSPVEPELRDRNHEFQAEDSTQTRVASLRHTQLERRFGHVALEFAGDQVG